jgi:hypothetical protein
MGILTTDMKRVVEEQRLGFVATVCPDGTPNLSPKGTTTVWDDDHLVFANIRSAGTLANLRHNASVEVNVVEALLFEVTPFAVASMMLPLGAWLVEARFGYMEQPDVPAALRACETHGLAIDPQAGENEVK